MIYVAIILFIAAVVICFYNNLKDAKNGHINHTKNLMRVKVPACTPSIVFFALATEARWIWALFFSSLLVGSWFYLLFEGVWGLKVYNDPFHKSTATGKNRGFGDKVVADFPRWAYITMKILFIIVSTYFYSKLL